MTPPRDPVRVAHVGHVGAPDDDDRWAVIVGWLRDHDPEFHARLSAPGGYHPDHLDLNRNPPRDFLAEGGRYDVVVTHNLWGEVSDHYSCRTGGTAQSPFHTVEGWHRRLAGSGALYVFLAGNCFNTAALGGGVPGYEVAGFFGPWYTSVLRAAVSALTHVRPPA